MVKFLDRISGLFFTGVLITKILKYCRTQQSELLMYLFIYILLYSIVNVIERIIQFSGYDIFMNISSHGELINLQREEHQKKCKLVVRMLAGSKILIPLSVVFLVRV